MIDYDGMTLREHLDELRKRLMFSVIFLVIAVVVAFMFRNFLLELILAPGYGDSGDRPIATEVLETVSVIFKVTLMAAFVVSLPVILYQIIMFISPGLTGRERAYLFIMLPAVLLAFAGGAAFAYFVLFPPAFEFLSEFGIEHVDPEIRISSYVSVIVSLMFWMGVVFQIPIVLFTLARFGVPIIILYEIGIVLARFGQRLHRGADPDAKPGIVRRVFRPLRIVLFWRWHWRFWHRGG